MEKSRLVVPKERQERKPEKPEAGSQPGRIQAWMILGWVGLAFLIVGGTDFMLTWYPASFGNREWEFATVTSSFDGLPILLVGLGALLAASIQTGRGWWAVVASLGAGVLLLWVVAGAVLWALDVPLALQSVPDNMAVGLRKALLKTLAQSLTYPLLLGYMALRGMRTLRRRGST